MRTAHSFRVLFPLTVLCFIATACGRQNSDNQATRQNLLTTGSISPAAPSKQFRTVMVERGDTLSRIARRHNVTIYDLMILNDMASPDIGVGQRLYLPTY